jgi:protein-disulfide isomerase
LGTAPECINDGRHLDTAKGLAAGTNITGTPTVRINGEDFTPTTPDALTAKIKEIVG